MSQLETVFRIRSLILEQTGEEPKRLTVPLKFYRRLVEECAAYPVEGGGESFEVGPSLPLMVCGMRIDVE